jgi:hypothetical protein
MTTRLDVRLALSNTVGDLTQGAVVSTSASGANTLIVDSRRTEPDDNWRGADIWISSGAASGSGSVVVASFESGTILEVYPPITTLDAAAAYELHAIPVADYHRVIEQAYDEIKHICLGQVVSTAYTMSSQEIDLSTLAASGWTHLYLIEIDRGDGWERIKSNQWHTVPVVHSVRFTPNMYYSYTSKKLRIFGYTEYEVPDSDFETFNIPRDAYTFLIYRGASLLLMQHPDWFDANAKSKAANRWEADASRAKQGLGTLLTSTVRLL